MTLILYLTLTLELTLTHQALCALALYKTIKSPYRERSIAKFVLFDLSKHITDYITHDPSDSIEPRRPINGQDLPDTLILTAIV